MKDNYSVGCTWTETTFCDDACFLTGISLPAWITKQEGAFQPGMLNDREIGAPRGALTRQFKVRIGIPFRNVVLGPQLIKTNHSFSDRKYTNMCTLTRELKFVMKGRMGEKNRIQPDCAV